MMRPGRQGQPGALPTSTSLFFFFCFFVFFFLLFLNQGQPSIELIAIHFKRSPPFKKEGPAEA